MDLTGGPHDGNIDAIFNAGITKGCDPPTYVNYCPTATVTREEMASFLARTAGLGGNPPVVNAKTAQTATSATRAGGADSATTAGDANTVGGFAPAGLARVARGENRTSEVALTSTYHVVGTVTLTAPAVGLCW